MKLSTLAEWLEWIGSVHKTEIELGLERIREVAGVLGVLKPDCPCVIVGGTNGKGSTVACLEAIYQQAGYKTGVFTSPVLFRHHEYVRVNGIEPVDSDFCQAYAAIEDARGAISLTPFEYHTLAALLICQKADPDILIFEVGLGGRLDAVNILDADVAVITSIGIDHTAWLGETRDLIAVEKAGILRSNGLAVCGDPDVPETLLRAAEDKNAALLCIGKDFEYQNDEGGWSWRANYPQKRQITHLPEISLAKQNAAIALMVCYLLQAKRPVSETQIRAGLVNATLPGRCQQIEGPITQIFDVAHNPAAVTWLKEALERRVIRGKTIAVFSMLVDKDIESCLLVIQEQISEWFIAPLQHSRAACMERLLKAFTKMNIKNLHHYQTIEDAYQAAQKVAQPGDCIIIFGSFYVVSKLLKEE